MGKFTSGLTNLWEIIKKYKYAALLLVIGIGLFLIPSSNEDGRETEKEAPTETVFTNYEKEMEERLTMILSQIEGVGNVRVILTLRQGEEHHFLTDNIIRTENKDGASTTETNEKTVIFSKGSSYDEPMITRTDYPLFQGALIVCEGGGNAEIKLQLTRAVSALTDLSSQNITILKMK